MLRCVGDDVLSDGCDSVVGDGVCCVICAQVCIM